MFSAITCSLSTTSAAFHEFSYVVSSSFFSNYFQIDLWAITYLIATYYGFSKHLSIISFQFHSIGNREHTLYILISLNLLAFVLWPSIFLSWRIFNMHLKRIYTLLLLGVEFNKCLLGLIYVWWCSSPLFPCSASF